MNHNLEEARRWLAQARHDADLDQYYISTRYPNGLPGGIPHEVYTKDQAEEAIAGTRKVLNQVERLLSLQQTR